MAVTKKDNKDENVQPEKTQGVFDDSHTEDTVGSENANITVETEEVESDKEATMPIRDVEKLLFDMEERLKNQFNSKLNAIDLGKAKAELDKDASYVADLEGDWLDAPVVFFAYSINFSIHGDNKRGVSTKPPFEAIKFKPVIRTKRQGRKGVEVISVSSVKVNSKSVVDYLRNHSQFGIAFFENMDSVLNIDSGWAHRLIEANQSIQRLSDQQVIARCRQENIPIGTDVPKMRKALVEDIAQKSIKRQDEMTYGALKKSNLEISGNSTRQIIEKTIQ